MAVGTSQTVFAMDTCYECLVAWMLGLQHRCLAQLMLPVDESPFIVVLLNIFSSQAVVPGEGDNFGGLLFSTRIGPLGRLEVILGMTLCTDQGSHILVVSFSKRLAAFGVQPAFQVIASYGKLHGFVIVAIRTANRVDYLAAKPSPLTGEETVFSMLINQSRYIR